MKIMHSEWQGRLKHWMRTLKDDFYEPLGEIVWGAFCTMEHITPEAAQRADFVPVKPGFTWGNTWEYCWFSGDITLSEEAKGQRIIMNLSPGGESALFVNGRAFGTYRASWVMEPHHYMEDNTLTRQGKAGDSFHILMETYGGHYYPEAEESRCATGPVIPGREPKDLLMEGSRRVLGTCTYGIWNEDAYQLYMDVSTLWKLLSTLDETSLRAARIARALEEFTLIVDFEQRREARTASYEAARKALRPVMEGKNGSTVPLFYGIGNAHLDLAWLWPVAETCRKTERTFGAQLRLMEEYPEYKFIQSQPAAYEMCRKHYPELFERIKEAIKTGQWIADGAMWVEPDTNMAGGEALIRQLVHGKRYYKDVLGVDSQVLWLPDTFGYSAALPQILIGCGVKYLVTQKIFWSYNEGDRFPYHYFTWQGMDGSKVVSFLPTSYTYRTDPQEINQVWKNRVQMQDLDSFLLPFGYGDGGGGPSRDYIEYARRQSDLEGGAKVKMASPLEFFQDMDAKGGPRDTYAGELYFSAHRGTYTSQAMVKNKNRRGEFALREMEFWSSLAMERGWDYDSARADALWKVLLFHQFHDILPGSSIARVYEEAGKAYDELLRGAEELTRQAQEALLEDPQGDGVTIWNSLSFERRALIVLPPSFEKGARTAEGQYVPVQKSGDRVKALVTIPACGAVSLKPEHPMPGVNHSPEERRQIKKEFAVSVREMPDGYVMENQRVKAVVDKKGQVVSFVLKESEREFAAGPMNRFHLYKDVPRTFDAWDIDSNYVMQEVEGAVCVTVEPVEEGLEGVLKATGKFGCSEFVQHIRLEAGSRRLVFETQVEWKELHRLLKVGFPVEVYGENGINEIQFGFIERPVHRSRLYDKDRFEVCNHRYSALCDAAHGAAVLNDCKYGISMEGNTLALTLLRAGASPEMQADNGRHFFTYGFTAWEGSFVDSDVTRQGYEINVKPSVTRGEVKAFRSVTMDKTNIILDTMKPAEDGSKDIVLRLYEAKKAAVKAQLRLGMKAKKVYLCDMLEHILEEIPFDNGKINLSFRAFEIKTIRLVRE